MQKHLQTPSSVDWSMNEQSLDSGKIEIQLAIAVLLLKCLLADLLLA